MNAETLPGDHRPLDQANQPKLEAHL